MKLFSVIFFIMSALIPCTSFSLVFDAMRLSKQLPTGKTQTLLLLGDCHEYLKDLETSSQETVSALIEKQRNEIINLAQQITRAQQESVPILIEDMVYGTSSSTLLGLPTAMILALDRYYKCYHPQVIANFTIECKRRGLEAYSIECRHADSILETPPPYLESVKRTIKKCGSFAAYPLTLFYPAWLTNKAMPVLKTIAHQITRFLTTAISVPALLNCFLAASQHHENRNILAQARKLHHDIKGIQQKITAIETRVKNRTEDALDDLVDLKALNFIIEHPEKETIIVCAGAWHIENIATYLEQYGYKDQHIAPALELKKAIKVNAEMDGIKPIAIGKTFEKNAPKLA